MRWFSSVSSRGEEEKKGKRKGEGKKVNDSLLCSTSFIRLDYIEHHPRGTRPLSLYALAFLLPLFWPPSLPYSTLSLAFLVSPVFSSFLSRRPASIRVQTLVRTYTRLSRYIGLMLMYMHSNMLGHGHIINDTLFPRLIFFLPLPPLLFLSRKRIQKIIRDIVRRRPFVSFLPDEYYLSSVSTSVLT